MQCCRVEYAPERPEWQQEKHRFFVELPGHLLHAVAFVCCLQWYQAMRCHLALPASAVTHDHYDSVHLIAVDKLLFCLLLHQHNVAALQLMAVTHFLVALLSDLLVSLGTMADIARLQGYLMVQVTCGRRVR